MQHLTREITEPATSVTRTGGDDTGHMPRSSSASTPDLPPEVFAQAIEQVVHRDDANWADETIPALGGHTPRQTIATAGCLERVKGLLREYEECERQQFAAQGRPAVSDQFCVRLGYLTVSMDGTLCSCAGAGARVLRTALRRATVERERDRSHGHRTIVRRFKRNTTKTDMARQALVASCATAPPLQRRAWTPWAGDFALLDPQDGMLLDSWARSRDIGTTP